MAARGTMTGEEAARTPFLTLDKAAEVRERIRVALSTEPPLVAEVTRQALDALGVTEGSEVYAAFKATALEPYR